MFTVRLVAKDENFDVIEIQERYFAGGLLSIQTNAKAIGMMVLNLYRESAATSMVVTIAEDTGK